MAVAVIVTDVPEQMVVPGLAAMLTVGVRFGLTTIVNPFDVAVVAVKQVPPVTVISQVTALPLARVVEVYILEAEDCTLPAPILKL